MKANYLHRYSPYSFYLHANKEFIKIARQLPERDPAEAAAVRSFVKMQRTGCETPMCTNTTHGLKKIIRHSALFNFKTRAFSFALCFSMHRYEFPAYRIRRSCSALPQRDMF